MLKRITHFICNMRNEAHTAEFYEVYKYTIGLYYILSIRKLLVTFIFAIMGPIEFLAKQTIPFMCIICSCILLSLQMLDLIKIRTAKGVTTSSERRTMKILNVIMMFINKKGKALGKKEWKAIKKSNIELYKALLSNESEEECYYYSLETARIVKDCEVIWGAVKDPLEPSNKYYAHAIIFKDGYVYDSNIRQSVEYKIYKNLYKLKKYRSWSYDEYSNKNFCKFERVEFRRWCVENNVLCYDYF